MAVVQGTILYVSEQTWNGRLGMEVKYQAAINRMGELPYGLSSRPLWVS